MSHEERCKGCSWPQLPGHVTSQTWTRLSKLYHRVVTHPPAELYSLVPLSPVPSFPHSLTHSSTHSLKGPYPVVPACQEDNRSMKLLFQVMCQDKVTELCADGQREFLKVILESGAGRGQQGNEF